MNIASPARMTAEEFFLRPDHERFELVGGRLEEIVTSMLSSRVGANIGRLLASHCDPLRLGWVLGANLWYRCFPGDPDTLRKPGVSFIRRGCLSLFDPDADLCPLAPDLVVQVLSRNDTASHVEVRLNDYLDAAVPLIWFVDPMARIVRVHRPGGPGARLRQGDEITGHEVVPGFACRVADLFPADLVGRA